MITRRVSRRMVIAAGLLALTCLVVLPGVPGPVQLLGGAVLVLVAPGAAFAHALRLGDHYSPAMVWLIVPAASMAFAILLSLVLHLLPAGLTRTSIAVGLLVITAVLALAGELWRPDRAPAQGAGRRAGLPAAGAAALLVFAGALMASSVLVARTGEEDAAQRTSFSQLWMLPGAEPGRLLIGMRSDEPGEQEFRVEVVVAGQPSTSRAWSIDLRPGESWEREITVQPGTPGEFLEARIFLPSRSEAYREAHVATSALFPTPSSGATGPTDRSPIPAVPN
jgi:hypothetical protein